MSRPRPALIPALLAATLLLLAALAWQAWRAARDRRVVALGALDDYAGFAAAEFARRSRDELTSVLLFGTLRPALGVNAAVPVRQLPPASILESPVERPGGASRPAIAVRGWFRLVLADGAITTGRDTLEAGVKAWVAAAVPAHARALQASNRYFGIVSGAPAGEDVVAAFASRYGAAGEVAVVYGLVAPAGGLAPVFDSVFAGPPLLPRGEASIPNATALVAEVVARGGARVFGLGAFGAGHIAAESLGTQFGGLVARVAVRPDAAGRLVIGGVPGAPLLPLLGSFAVGAALLVVALRQHRRESELARLREDFVAGVSHELRTPLAQIRLFAETLELERTRDEGERRRALGIVHAEARRLSHLVENLLQFSRAGRPQALAPERLEVGALAGDVVEGFTPLLAPRQITVRIDVPAALSVFADRDALRQVFLNLLDNTLKHGPPGQVVTLQARSAEGRVRIAVEDAGPGVPAADRERVFDRFVRLQPARGTTGAGLGLAVVRALVEQQGGRVWIEAGRGGGARVVLELPGA